MNVGIFVLCYLGFVLWRGKFKIYYARLVLRQTRIKPPPLHVRGHWRFWCGGQDAGGQRGRCASSADIEFL